MIVKLKIELDKLDEDYHFGLSIEFKNKLLINSEKEIHFLYEIDKILYFPFFHLFFTSMGNCNCTTNTDKEKLS